jgi:hypothetical protein
MLRLLVDLKGLSKRKAIFCLLSVHIFKAHINNLKILLLLFIEVEPNVLEKILMHNSC